MEFWLEGDSKIIYCQIKSYHVLFRTRDMESIQWNRPEN